MDIAWSQDNLLPAVAHSCEQALQLLRPGNLEFYGRHFFQN